MRCTYRFAHGDRGQCVLPDDHDGYHEDWSNRNAEVERLRNDLSRAHEACEAYVRKIMQLTGELHQEGKR